MTHVAARKTRVIIATALGFIATSIAIVMIAVTWFDPPNRSEYFWSRIIWTVFLIGLAWAYIGAFFSLLSRRSRSVKGLGAILPGMGVAIFFYVGSSLLLMIFATFWPDASSWELVSRVYKAAGLIVVLIFLYFSWAAGVADTELIPAGILTPHALATLLRRGEEALSTQHSSNTAAGVTDGFEALALSLKALRERIEYSIPHVGRIGEESSYFAFSSAVKQLSDDCLQMSGRDLNVGEIQIRIRQVNDLKNEIQHIAQTLRNS